MAVLPTDQMMYANSSATPGQQGQNAQAMQNRMRGGSSFVQDPQRLARRRGVLPMGGMAKGFPSGWMQGGQQRQSMNPNMMRFAFPQMMGGFRPQMPMQAQPQPMNAVMNPNMVQMRRGY